MTPCKSGTMQGGTPTPLDRPPVTPHISCPSTNHNCPPPLLRTPQIATLAEYQTVSNKLYDIVTRVKNFLNEPWKSPDAAALDHITFKARCCCRWVGLGWVGCTIAAGCAPYGVGLAGWVGVALLGLRCKACAMPAQPSGRRTARVPATL